MTLSFQDQVEQKIYDNKKLSSEKEELLKINKEMSEMVYSLKTSQRINQVVADLSLKFRDYRSIVMKRSSKLNLTTSIMYVCQVSVKFINEKIEKNEKDIVYLQEKITNIINNDLAEKVSHYEEEYIRGFSKISEGMRCWQCLIQLVEDGDVKEEDLMSYGIDLSIPAKTF